MRYAAKVKHDPPTDSTTTITFDATTDGEAEQFLDKLGEALRHGNYTLIAYDTRTVN